MRDDEVAEVLLDNADQNKAAFNFAQFLASLNQHTQNQDGVVRDEDGPHYEADGSDDGVPMSLGEMDSRAHFPPE